LYFSFARFQLKFTRCFSHTMEVSHLSGDMLVGTHVKLIVYLFLRVRIIVNDFECKNKLILSQNWNSE